jgi:hypothetical protein
MRNHLKRVCDEPRPVIAVKRIGDGVCAENAPSEQEAIERFTVQTKDIPRVLFDMGFVAWVADAQHPDLFPGVGDPIGLSVAWSQSLCDAERVATALNLKYRSESQEG